MTPREEKFKEFFQSEVLLVKDMDTLTLRAHIQELSDIAHEARARLTAADGELRTRDKKPGTGFEANVNVDEVTSDAINKIQKGARKLTKEDKVRASLRAAGMSEEDIDTMMSPQTILAIRNKKEGEVVTLESAKQETSKQFDPFGKKAELDELERIEEAAKVEAEKAAAKQTADSTAVVNQPYNPFAGSISNKE